ncbi:MAG: phenylalanine--tRNA ligase subunit beta, partial [Patescibacteria group bacterium]
MYISLSWLKEFVDIPKNISIEELSKTLTLKTAEVEGIKKGGQGLEGVVIGEIKEIQKHTNAEKLNLAKVDIGKDKPLNLIFGQMVTMKIGNRIPVAVAPTTLPSGAKIEKKLLRGMPSEGMLCLDQELGFKDEGVSIQYFPNTPPGTPLAEALNLEDTTIEFDNKALTHRPDLWGHYGIAREIAALTNGKLKPYTPKVTFPKTGESIKVEVKDFDLCKRFCGLIINNIKVEESPQWMQKRLKASGHGTHNNIVDVTNYVMAELGQPMHAFDKDYIKKGLVIRRAQKNEKIISLDGKKRILDEEMCVVADHEKAVGVAGIIGGENSEINDKTTSIILEAATWNPSVLRRTSVKLGVRTEAVQRFEKSLDPNWGELAIKKAAELILKICPTAKIAGPMTDVKKSMPKPLQITLSTEKAQTKIGADISAKEMKTLLELLEFKVSPKGKKAFTVTVPSFRATKDIHIEDDLIEEIARMHGYENLPAILPTLPTKLPIENVERFKKHKARELLSYGLGFDEVYNYSFYGKKELGNCLMTESGHVKLLNYLSEDQTLLRTSLVPNMLKNLQLNAKSFPEIRIYEIGRTYKEINSYFPLEEKIITGMILSKNNKTDSFYEAKGVVEAFFEKFSIPKAKLVKGVETAPYAHPSKALSFISYQGQTLSKVFMIHPQVIKNHDLGDVSVATFTLNFTELMKLKTNPKSYKQIQRFPVIEFDVSVVINKTTEIEKIKETILSSDKNLISN